MPRPWTKFTSLPVTPTGLLPGVQQIILMERTVRTFLNMRDESWSSVEVRFIDLDQVIRDLRNAAHEARRVHPEVVKIYLFGSLVKGNWTADSDADLIVVVRKEFPDLVRSRSAYQIFTSSIPTDTLVYSEREFEQLQADPSSLVAQEFPFMAEL